MSNNIIIGIGLAIIVVGVVMILSSGADFSNLPLNDFTASFGGAEVTASYISPEDQTTMTSGFAASIEDYWLLWLEQE